MANFTIRFDVHNPKLETEVTKIDNLFPPRVNSVVSTISVYAKLFTPGGNKVSIFRYTVANFGLCTSNWIAKFAKLEQPQFSEFSY